MIEGFRWRRARQLVWWTVEHGTLTDAELTATIRPARDLIDVL